MMSCLHTDCCTLTTLQANSHRPQVNHHAPTLLLARCFDSKQHHGGQRPRGYCQGACCSCQRSTSLPAGCTKGRQLPASLESSLEAAIAHHSCNTVEQDATGAGARAGGREGVHTGLSGPTSREPVFM